MLLFFFFNDTATTEIYTLSLHDALPICRAVSSPDGAGTGAAGQRTPADQAEREHADTQQQVKDVVGVVQRREVGRVAVLVPGDREAVDRERQVDHAAPEEVRRGRPDGPGHREAGDTEEQVDDVVQDRDV